MGPIGTQRQPTTFTPPTTVDRGTLSTMPCQQATRTGVNWDTATVNLPREPSHCNASTTKTSRTIFTLPTSRMKSLELNGNTKEFNVMCHQPSFNPLNHNHYAHHYDPVIILRGVEFCFM